MRTKQLAACLFIICLILPLCGCTAVHQAPETVLAEYLECWSQANYDGMYDCLSAQAQAGMSRDAFVLRYNTIFSALKLTRIAVTSQARIEAACNDHLTTFQVSVELYTETISSISLRYTIPCSLDAKGMWHIDWSPALIFPELEEGQTVHIERLAPIRGGIFDRNGFPLAENGPAYSVCALPSEISDTNRFAASLAPLLEVQEASILEALSAPWIEENTLVPLRTFSLNLPQAYTDELLSIEGVVLDTSIINNSRRYLCNDLYAHIIGYVQHPTEDELSHLNTNDYTETDYIGRSGIEKAYEEQLHGTCGYTLYSREEDGKRASVIAEQLPKSGVKLFLTIDHEIQALTRTLLQSHSGSIIVLRPNTGEILAMVSMPSFDANDFVNGLLPSKWAALASDPENPLFNRSTQALYPPGSTIKPFIAAMALDEEIIAPDTVVKECNATTWVPFENWNAPPIKRVPHPAAPVDLNNALIWSDNIYFAWIGLQLQPNAIEAFFKQTGFTSPMSFDLPVSQAQLKNTASEWSSGLLAATAQGQGEVLTTPLQIAELYTAFANSGSTAALTLISHMDRSDPLDSDAGLTAPDKQIIHSDALNSAQVDLLLPMLQNVVDDPTGSAHAIKEDTLHIAAKTGTAQLSRGGEDEIAWFVGLTLETDDPLLICVTLEAKEKQGGIKLDMASALYEAYYGLHDETDEPIFLPEE